MAQVPTNPPGVANRARELYYGIIVFGEPHGPNTKAALNDLADDAYHRVYPDTPAKIAPGDQAGADAWTRIRADMEGWAVAQAKPNPSFDPKKVTWPLATMPTGWPPGSKFAASRPWGKPQERYHTGIDLAASLGAAVLAPEEATIVARNSGWEMARNDDGTWRGVKSIILKTDTGRTWLLGGIRPDSASVQNGERVKAGQQIASVGAYPGGDHMLHVALYNAPLSEAQVNAQKEWKLGGTKPKNLIDPAPFLEAAKANVKQVLALQVPPSNEDIQTGETDEGTPQAAGPGSNTATAPAPASNGKGGGIVAGFLAASWARSLSEESGDPMAIECTPLNLEGGTLENPCINIWGCGAFDYQRLRRKLQLERNTLVAYLNAFHKLVLAGRAKESGAVRIAYDLADEESWKMLVEQWPAELVLQTSWWERWTGPGQVKSWVDERTAYKQACKELAVMASRCRAAWCDVGNAIADAGDKPPSTPIAPPPPEGWGDSILDFSIKVAKSVGALALAAGLVLGGVYVVNRARERST